jgi:hypothetical protein
LYVVRPPNIFTYIKRLIQRFIDDPLNYGRLGFLESSDIDGKALQDFQKKGIEIYTKTSVKSIEKGTQIKLQLEKDGKQLSLIADKVIIAIGVIGNVENLGLENLNGLIPSRDLKILKYIKTLIKHKSYITENQGKLLIKLNIISLHQNI